jgi:serine/threonine-protein kinase HipA
VPENEYAMLTLARHIGIDVPEIHLIKVGEVQGLPSLQNLNQDQKALVIKRFDRDHGKRIHIEDLAQVYSVYPNKKYQCVSYNNIANMLASVTGEPGVKFFIQRLVFNLLIGNGDMHLKNWSLIYSDGCNAQLAPAYDFVATRYFMNNKRLALSIAGHKNMDEITLQVFRRFADKAQISESMTQQVVEETTQLTVEA